MLKKARDYGAIPLLASCRSIICLTFDSNAGGGGGAEGGESTGGGEERPEEGGGETATGRGGVVTEEPAF